MVSLAYGALWAFIFAVPWENMISVPGIGTISKFLGMIALACTVFAALVNGRVRHLRLVHISALVFVIWAGGSVFRSIDQHWASLRFGTYLQLFLMLWMIWELAPGVRRQRGLMTAYVLGAYVASLATILVFRTEAGAARRYAATGFDANDLGTILALALPMAWYLGMTYRQPILRWICLGYVPVGIFAIGLTASRGAMVVGTVALLIVPLMMTRLSPAKMVGVIMVLIACGGIAAVYIPKRSLDRLGTFSADVEEGHFGGRGTIWKAGLRAFAQRPLTGYGAASFKGAVSTFMGRGAVAHNTYLSVLVEQGILGFVPWFMMFVAVFFQVRRLPPLERRFGMVLMATLGIAILPLSWDDRKPVWMILAVLAAFSEALRQGRAGTSPIQIQQPHPLRSAPVARRAVTPIARVNPTSRPSAGPNRTPFHDA
jgi:O-antigen ligase